ncbi:aminoglycoside phosphotransferase family protein [Micromonospora sp. RHAY321]|uniref:aminoglycoside phosphotransferase family protein n=1 Tax=Micromonospora sp. RHAY321 TaxID=2944807 RepID=UPI00207D5C77|nr:aminoglycoside phosphotransferase family protein [Micromonospora sp. RHAY321]MCO1597888.1 aminoglycoside phosphotransferase family protein [Micromonospora sp. RHAY321]
MTESTDLTGEERLAGGFIADVVRIGDTVRRTAPANLDFVGALLDHLAAVGADIAPRHLGVDALGRQMLSHVQGRVPWREREDESFFADPALVRLAELIRRLHDACAGTALAGDAETVCHRDLSPKNTVYRDFPSGPLPVAFLDWDLAAPGPRIADVAFAGWHWAALGEGADPAEVGRRCRVLCDAYEAAATGPDPAPLAREELVDVMLHQIEDTWRGIDAGADRDEPGMRRLRDGGAVEGVRHWQDWLLAHRRTVVTVLTA